MKMAFDAQTEISDDALMVLYANGDKVAAVHLANRHTPRILALAFRLLRDNAEAEDVAQETMLRLWKIAPEWRQGEAKVSTWAYRVASNLCTDRLRKKKGKALDEIPEPVDEAESVEAEMVQAQRFTSLRDAMSALPERQRIAVNLRHIEELSNPEIAKIMDITVEAVESLTARGKRTLAEMLRPKKEEIGYDS